jgi:transposase-like protein
MPRIDTTEESDKWRYRCAECGSVSWRANNGSLTCRACSTTGIGLVDAETGEEYTREEI